MIQSLSNNVPSNRVPFRCNLKLHSRLKLFIVLHTVIDHGRLLGAVAKVSGEGSGRLEVPKNSIWYVLFLYGLMDL